MLSENTLLQNRYLIEKKLGQGGMGAVYRAIDKRFDTPVALKETLVTDENLRKAFEREARMLNKLRHAALPHVIDFFAEGDGEFLVMQFIPGDDLGELLQRNGRPFGHEQVVTWAEQILAALEYLHSYDPPIVHRDIKPQNIKLTPQGEVILLDFGLSKGSALEVSQAAGGASVAGYTPHFAPLEQIRGSGTNPRSDLYSLAATLYLLLTATRPPDALERASATLGGRPDPLKHISQLNPSVPPQVAQVLMQGLSQMPEHRWVSAKAMRNALAEAMKGGPATVAQRPADTAPISRPPAGFPSGPPSLPQSGGQSMPNSGPSSYPPMQPMTPTSAPTLPQHGQVPYQTAPGAFTAPGPQSWPNSGPPPMQQSVPVMQQSVPVMPQSAYASYASVPQPKPRTVRWTLFVVWLVIGLGVALFGAAFIAVLAVGEDPPTSVVGLLTLLIYVAGAIALFIWCKL